MSTMEHNFEPMTTGMVLDKAFRLYINNFVLMIGLSAILNIPLLVFNSLFRPAISIGLPMRILPRVLIGLVAFVSLLMLIIGPFDRRRDHDGGERHLPGEHRDGRSRTLCGMAQRRGRC